MPDDEKGASAMSDESARVDGEYPVAPRPEGPVEVWSWVGNFQVEHGWVFLGLGRHCREFLLVSDANWGGWRGDLKPGETLPSGLWSSREDAAAAILSRAVQALEDLETKEVPRVMAELEERRAKIREAIERLEREVALG